jgi:5-methylcytosine-specific restriction endonuclease McrA
MSIVQLSLPVDGKTCTRCDQWLPFGAFDKKRAAPSGHRAECKQCRSKRSIALAMLRPPPTGTHKTCNTCKQLKPYEGFPKANESRDGRSTECRACRNAGRKARHEQRIVADPTYRESVATRARAWYRDNPERGKERAMTWYRANPARVTARRESRRAREMNAEGSFTEQEWRDLCAHYGNRCLCCGASGVMTADHVIPLARGGSNDISNIQPLCRHCNATKHTKATDYRPPRE